jgi:hypothetical protein
MRAPAAFITCALLIATSAAAQPSVVNGTLDARAATGPLEREFAAILARDGGPAWIGYEAPIAGRDHQLGCWSDDRWPGGSRVGPLRLEGPETFFVLYRIEERRVERIRIASSECQLDAGGRTVHWLAGIRVDDSIAWLETFIAGDSSRRSSNSAIAAIAMHAGTAATDRLIALARANESTRVRSDALFWLGQRAGDKAVGTITDAIDRDPDTEVKKKAVFALSQLPKDQGVPLLIDVARGNQNPAVRKQAMFWLGQSHDPRALRFFEEILRK